MSYIFAHGLGQTASAWDKVLERLERQPECVCPDLPELIRGKEVRQYAELYEIFSGCCDKVSGPVHLCGLSLGGILALNYTIDHPDKVLSLVLIGAQYKMPKRLLRFQNVLFHLMPGSMFDQIGFRKQDYISLSKSMMELDFSGNWTSCFALPWCCAAIETGPIRRPPTAWPSAFPMRSLRLWKMRGMRSMWMRQSV